MKNELSKLRLESFYMIHINKSKHRSTNNNVGEHKNNCHDLDLKADANAESQ